MASPRKSKGSTKPTAPAPRIVVRPKAIDSEQFQVEPDPEVDGGFIVRGTRPERWMARCWRFVTTPRG